MKLLFDRSKGNFFYYFRKKEYLLIVKNFSQTAICGRCDDVSCNGHGICLTNEFSNCSHTNGLCTEYPFQFGNKPSNQCRNYLPGHESYD